jgi:predicted metalloprotease with PDZ domain
MINNMIRSAFKGKRALGWLVGASLLATQAHAQSTDAGTVDVLLRPVAADSSQLIPFVDVTVKTPASEIPAGAPLMRMPLVTYNVQTVAASLQDLKASDADGPVTLTFHDDADGQTRYRHWTASRAVHGPLNISYRADITNALNPRGAAPPYELRSESGAFSGLLGTFVLLPDSDKSYRLSMDWDFSSLRGKSLGVSTLGLGKQSSKSPKTSEDLQANYVMGGHLEHEPEQPAADGFFSAWQGTPPFDARPLMQWTHRLYGFYLKFYDAPPTTYNVFLRRNKINAGGGVEVGNSFVGTFDDGTPVEDFKVTLAHEMVHTFVGELDEKEDFSASWFSEGLAVYYERLLPLRAGQFSRDEYLMDLNSTAARYYTDLLNTTPNADIAARFWADTRIRVLPYDRGSLYFAQLNAQIKKASQGKRSLDDLVLEFLQRRRAGQPLTQAAWVDAITHELGAPGKQSFEDMLSGKPIVLDSDTFGPCFHRIQKPMKRYELGFAPEVLVEPKRIIRGLVPGSTAAAAGLQNGDEILKPVPQDSIQADQQAQLKLQIRRADKVFEVSYLPRGEQVQTYQWEKSDSAQCVAG